MTYKVNPKFGSVAREILAAFEQFEESGREFVNGERNKIKVFEIGDLTVNIKSFKVPNKINQFVYRNFRKSKAVRSFEFANILRNKKIGTPEPVAYMESYNWLGLQRSFYASIQQEYDLTFRELVEIPDYPDHENILRQFIQFCYKIHESGIEFKDHSPGNTLIKKTGENQYEFYLVDLNRMNFHDSMDMEMRMKNLSRLTPKKEMVKIMADEYALISGENPENLFKLLWNFTSKFQTKYHRKLNAKNKLKTLLKKN